MSPSSQKKVLNAAVNFPIYFLMGTAFRDRIHFIVEWSRTGQTDPEGGQNCFIRLLFGVLGSIAKQKVLREVAGAALATVLTS